MLIDRFSLKAALTIVLILLFERLACPQEQSDMSPVRLMFYNVENLFDTSDNPLKEDDEFLPDGLMRWNKTRYLKKISSVYKTILAAGGWDPPAIVGLCEIENRQVLEDLVYRTALSNFGFEIIHNESPDPRGIDVCMIFRKDLVKVINYRSLIPRTGERNEYKTRSVLYAKCLIDEDTLHLMVNHWPSRRGGVLAGEPLREDIATMLNSTIDSLYVATKGNLKLVVMGDFNCNPDDQVIRSLTGEDGFMINLADHYINAIRGTYRYAGTWEMLDQIIISKALTENSTGLFTGSGYFRIFAPDFLLRRDAKYPGMTTYSTYRGYRYQGGFSDHLPVLLDLGIR